MPGKPATDQQVRVYMNDRVHRSQRIAAARAGFSERTARRIDADPRLPSQRKPERRRTVADPLEAVWEPVLLTILQRDPAVQAVTLLRHLQMTDPDRFPDDRVRRTLERRVRNWRALHGPERDVIFRQTPEPGRMALSDFTDTSALGITIAGVALPHRLYHFVLAYSGWEHAAVVLGGESFTALAENLQNALWALGGVPMSIAPTACQPPIATSMPKLPVMSPNATPPSAATTACWPVATTQGKRMRTVPSRRTTIISKSPSTKP